jgi:N-acetylneuraminate synthase
MENTTTPAATEGADGANQNGIAPLKPEIVFDDFGKIDLRVGTIIEAKKVEKADKLLELLVDLGFEQRTILSGIAMHFNPEDIVGKQVTIVANLAPRKMRGIESKGMIFISTPFSRAAAERLKKFDIPAYKIGSGECNNYPLLEHICTFGKPVILSTGMNTIESVQKAVAIFDKHNIPVALLHTTNLYPTPIHLVRFGAMTQLHDAFPDKVFGLSDHTLNNNACLGAVALGASILERHFTDHMQRTGPDIVCSMDEKACAELIVSSNEIWQMRGGTKEPAKEEQVTIDFAFATVCSIATIQKGEKLSKENIWVKRPGTGKILAEQYNNLLGKTATRTIENDEQLDFNDFE